MALKLIKNDSKSFVTFSVDGVTYSMNMHHEIFWAGHENDEYALGEQVEFAKAEIRAGPKKITMKKKSWAEGSPLAEYQITGEGPELEDEDECRAFLAECILVVVVQQFCFSLQEDQDDIFLYEGAEISGKCIASINNFMALFHKYFGEEISEAMDEASAAI